MLTQCVPDRRTKAFVYISDPFIRRLTGPEMKIGQLRRIVARMELESLAAGHLLDRMTGKDPAAVIEELRRISFTPGMFGETSGFFKMDWVRELGRDRWLAHLQFFNTLTLRISMEVQGYRIHLQPSVWPQACPAVTNGPWSTAVRPA